MKLPFRIRTIYFNKIVEGKKTSEVRKASIFWDRLVEPALLELAAGKEIEGVFICGRRVHRRYVTKIQWFKNPQQALGRQPSARGLQDLGTGPVYKFSLGHAVDCNFVAQLEAAS